MSRKNPQAKKDFIKVFLNQANDNSRDEQAAREFLQSEGYDVERAKKEGINRIRQMKLDIEAAKTEQEMEAAAPLRLKATEWVNTLLSNATFDLRKLVEEEELTMSFSHMEHLTTEELKNLLIKHFTLKFMKG
ncbi:MAG: hypothetical protein P4L51_18230 [Puia sp.]|nr:hypothetical protein [Puia sp.]